MRFVVDSHIPFAIDALSPLGEVVAIPGAAVAPEAVADADVLWVRSTVRVGEALLGGSRVRLVGTVTSGTDHLDLPWLEEAGIAWVAAPGANAGAVQLWWAAALCTLAERRGFALAGRRVGIVGVGHVGRKVEAFARALGCEVLLCDPPRARQEGKAAFLELAELLDGCDLLTLHVPLTRTGPDPTWHLVGARELARLPDGAVVVNSARGAVVDSRALVGEGRRLGLVLDVFEGEPAVPPELVAAAAIATPHVAGHSLDGRVAAMRAVYEATCRFLGADPAWPAPGVRPLPGAATVPVETAGARDDEVVLRAVRRLYRIEQDDAALRRVAGLPGAERGRAFEGLRTAYPDHREPVAIDVVLDSPRPAVAAALAALGAAVTMR